MDIYDKGAVHNGIEDSQAYLLLKDKSRGVVHNRKKDKLQDCITEDLFCFMTFPNAILRKMGTWEVTTLPW